MNGDLFGSIIVISYTLLLLILFKISRSKVSVKYEHIIFQMLFGLLVFILPIFENKVFTFVIPIMYLISNYMIIKQKNTSKPVILSTISISIIFYFGSEWQILVSVFSVIYGDNFAYISGKYVKSGSFRIFNNTKTLIGSLINSFISWITVLIGVVLIGESISLAIVLASISAVLVPIIEILSPKGTDNLIVPLSMFAILYTLEEQIFQATVYLPVFIISIILGAIVAIFSFKKQFLTFDGALAGFMLAVVMLGLTGWTFGIQLFLFFFIGTLATKLAGKKHKKMQDEFEKGSSRRDSKQALAKAGSASIFSLIYILYPSQLIFYLFSGILTAALTDTMSTEVGITFKGKTRPVLRPWRLAEKGEAGAISAVGTLGGFVSGLLFTSTVYLISKVDVQNDIDSVMFILIVSIAGIIGMLSDSVIGSTIQRMNICTGCGKILEANSHCGEPTEYHKGWKFMKNDLVNFIGTLTGGVASLIIYIIVL